MNGSWIRTAVVGGLVALLVFVLGPDLVRYIKISSM